MNFKVSKVMSTMNKVINILKNTILEEKFLISTPYGKLVSLSPRNLNYKNRVLSLYNIFFSYFYFKSNN